MTSITASLGVASYPDRGRTGFVAIQATDAALYRAKAAGRNQVIVADRSGLKINLTYSCL